MLIRITKKQLEKCKEFAEACAPTNHYKERGQSNMQKRKQDIVNGKQAEFAVYKFFKDIGLDVNEPDLEIYRGGQKRHGKDFEVEGIHIEVKSQTIDSMKAYGMSWLAEKKALPKLKDHLFIFCTIIEDQYIMLNNICLYDELVIGEPKLSYLKSKVAIYYEDILIKKFNEFDIKE